MVAFCTIASLWSFVAWSIGLGAVLPQNPAPASPAPVMSSWSPESLRISPSTKVVWMNTGTAVHNHVQWLETVSRLKATVPKKTSIVEIDATGDDSLLPVLPLTNQLSFAQLYSASLTKPPPRAGSKRGHEPGQFHYQILYQARFGNVFSYPAYCGFEQTFSELVESYIRDTSSRIFFIYVKDPLWFSDESLPSRFTGPQDPSKWMRVCVRDLDTPIQNTMCPISSHATIYLWDKHMHDFL